MCHDVAQKDGLSFRCPTALTSEEQQPFRARALHDWIERHRARRRKLKEYGAIASVASVGTTASGGRTGYSGSAVGARPTQPFATPQRSLVDSDDDTTGVGGLDYDEDDDNEEVRGRCLCGPLERR